METKFRFTDSGRGFKAIETASGDLIVEGYAAVFDGIDRSGENFAPGAFRRGIDAFLKGSAALVFHHHTDMPVGKVVELREDDRGLWLRGIIFPQNDASPLKFVRDGIKRGSIANLSIGGFFKRSLTANGYKIIDVDFTEVSATAVPAHPGTSLSVAAGKALGHQPHDDIDDRLLHQVRMMDLEVRIMRAERDLTMLLREGR